MNRLYHRWIASLCVIRQAITYVRMYVCWSVCMYACMYICKNIVCMCLCGCMYVCMYVCLYVCIYTHTYMYNMCRIRVYVCVYVHVDVWFCIFPSWSHPCAHVWLAVCPSFLFINLFLESKRDPKALNIYVNMSILSSFHLLSAAEDASAIPPSAGRCFFGWSH